MIKGKCFYAAIALCNPCKYGSAESQSWMHGALNGRADRSPPTERNTPAYYEGWQWGREWAESEVEL